MMWKQSLNMGTFHCEENNFQLSFNVSSPKGRGTISARKSWKLPEFYYIPQNWIFV